MAEITIQAAATEVPNDSAGISSSPPNDVAPSAANSRPAAKSSTDKDAPGVGNNWRQTPVYRTVAQPADFDHGRPVDSVAKLGYLRDGRPWSPYGVTPGGRIRIKPSSTMEGRDTNVPPEAAPPMDRRLAPGDLKPPANVAGLYAAIDDSHKRTCELVLEAKRQHPESKLGLPPHPKAVGAGEVMRADPHFGAATVGEILTSTTGFLAKKLDDPSAKPSPKAIEEASRKISEASRFYGINTDPKSTATLAAVIAVIMIFLPAAFAALGKLIDKMREPHHAHAPN